MGGQSVRATLEHLQFVRFVRVSSLGFFGLALARLTPVVNVSCSTGNTDCSRGSIGPGLAVTVTLGRP